MCDVISIAVPSTYRGRLTDHVPRGLHVERQENASIARQIGDGYVIFTVTRSGCSCGLYRPTGNAHAGCNGGVSPASGLRPDVVQAIRSMAKVVDHVRLFVHWYRGSVSGETIELAKTVKVPLPALSEAAERLRRDQPLEVRLDA